MAHSHLDDVQEDTMTLQHTPAPARSDLPRTPAPVGGDRPFRVHGAMLSIGAAAWAASIAAVGLDPREGSALITYGLGSGLFQIGLLALLRVLWRTRALGDGRWARFFVRVETLFLSLAICSTLVDTVGVSDLTEPGWLLLDAFWPFSMLGMFLIGIRIAVAGRWRGASRFWPMVAESWAVVVVPTMGIAGARAAAVVAVVHLLVGYTVLGRLVARKTA